ncbi:MAG: hypothetical protein AB1566_09720 [Chloroflexota bacterium]
MEEYNIYLVAFVVLLAAGLLLIVFGYGILQSQLVVIVAVLIPAGLSLGLVAEFLPGQARSATPRHRGTPR